MTEEKEDSLLIARDQYLAAGIHIGTQIKTQDMVPFIYRITRAGLYVIDIRQTDARMRIAARFISRFDSDKIVVVSARRYGHNPIQQFAHIVGAHAIPGRFVPGTLTNPNARSYLECDLLVITDPRADRQALKEAKIAKIPVISFCDTDNNLGNIDMCVPANNRGRKALALIFWLLTRGVLLERGEIVRPEDFNVEAFSFQSRGKISYELTGDRQKILEQLKGKEGEEEKKVPEEKFEEKIEDKPEEEPAELPPEKPEPEVKAEVSEPEVKAEVSEPEVKAEVSEPEVKAEVSEPEVKAEVSKPEVKAEVSEPEVKAEVSEPEVKPEKLPEEPVSDDIIRPPEKEGDVVKPEDLIEGPLPKQKPKKAAKKKSKKKSSKKKSKKESPKSEDKPKE